VDAKEAVKSLAGEQLTDNLIESAAKLASESEITPYGNIHASPEFQRHLANVLTKKALKRAVGRAEAALQ
jgi:carbon-monoxide dehydrogenase medium subunit